MHYSAVILLAALAARSSAHGVVTEIQGANGVNMPGLSVIDGTPRDCASPNCGSEADTSIIRDNELGGGKASALGRTKGGGPVDAAAAIANFMGNGKASTGSAAGSASTPGAGSTAGTGSTTGTGSTAGTGSTGSTGTGATTGATGEKRGLLGNLLGGGAGGNGGGAAGAGAGAGAGANAQGQKTAKGTSESGVSKAAGAGASSGLPTCSEDGTITMTFHQVNQDGAGALTADVDPTSGGTDPNAFQKATVTQDVPGLGNLGLSGATTEDFPVKVQMPQGMTCSGSAGGAQNVCIARLRNNALAGPFGGSVAFTQSAGAKKRAIEYNLRKRHFARGVLGKLGL